MRHAFFGWALLTLSTARAFGPLFTSEALRERIAIDSCERCKSKLGNTLGDEWMSCVADDLLRVQQTAKADGSNRYFPVVSTEMAKLRPGGSRYGSSDELANILRNYSCEISDGGSQPLRSFEWTYQPVDPCAGKGGSGVASLTVIEAGGVHQQRFAHDRGFLPAGNDLRSERMTEQAAQDACWADTACAGFTYSFSGSEKERAEQKHNILFKTSSQGASSATGWHTWRKLKQLDCSNTARAARSSPLRMTVNVLRESPPVYTIDDFVSDHECEQMLADTIPKMGRSVVGGGGTSNWRQVRRAPHPLHTRSTPVPHPLHARSSHAPHTLLTRSQHGLHTRLLPPPHPLLARFPCRGIPLSLF